MPLLRGSTECSGRDDRLPARKHSEQNISGRAHEHKLFSQTRTTTRMTISCRTMAAAATSLALLTLITPPAQAFYIDERQSPQTSEWNYAEQPRWAQMNRECSGRAQSPIDIQHKNVITSQHLRLHFYNYDKPLKFKLSNAHHTIKMNPTGIAAYELDQAGSGGAARSNHSGAGGVPNDIITADEYLEFTSAHGGAGQPAIGGVADNEQLSRLTAAVAATKSGGPAVQQTTRSQTGRRGPPIMNVSSKNSEREHESGTVDAAAAAAAGNSLLAMDEPNGPAEGDNNLSAHGATTSEPYDGAPSIKLDWLDDGNNEYKLRDIHFHWGERRDNGSEHAIDGRRAAMEMHLVHIKHGLDKSKIGFTSDSVTVIAILIESHRKSNADFNPIVNELSRINSTEQAQEIDYKSIYDLLPGQLQAFYTYSGSLTTPPCYQVVNWIVMAERLNMNAKQIEMFRNLYAPPHEHEDDNDDHNDRDGDSRAHAVDDQPSQGNRLGARVQGGSRADDGLEHKLKPKQGEDHNIIQPIMPNVRNIQPLNNRTILASFTKHGSRLESANLYALTGAASSPRAMESCHAVLLLATAAAAIFAQKLITANYHSEYKH